MSEEHPYLYSVLSSVEAEYFRPYALPQHQDRFQRISVRHHSPVVAVGAHAVHLPFGFALAEIQPWGTSELLSVCVKQKHRRRGIGRRLLELLERELGDRQARELTVIYERGRSYTDAMEPFLAATGFSEPEVYAVKCQCLFDRMREAPWLHKRMVPAAFELFLWKDLGSEDRQSILRRQEAAPWYPEQLSPFTEGASFEPLNSLGVRYEGEVVGWQINHRVSEDTIQYTITFVREDLQPLGVGALLMIESSRLQVDKRDPGLNKAFFCVPLAMKGMMAYIENRLKPYVDEMTDCLRTTKSLR